MEVAKVESFSDGVFSVAITLLIYHIEIPEFAKTRTNSQLLKELKELWPYYISFFISFFTILIMWVNHYRIFRMIHKMDRHFLFANGFLLLLVTVVPYPTIMVSEFLLTPAANTACAVYAGIFVLVNIAYNWLWYTARHGRKLLIGTIAEQKIRKITRLYLLGLPMYLLAFAFAFINVFISLAICMALWGFWAGIMKIGRQA